MRQATDSVNPPSPPAQAELQAMAEAAWRFDFFHALRLIDAQHQRLPRLGTARRPVDEPVRLGQSTLLGFAPSSLAAVDLADRSGRPRVEVHFFGLFGPNGPLPLHLSAYAHQRKHNHKDETFARFADLFHHRLLLLFYRAWAQARPAVSLDRPDEDRFADYVGSLLGTGGRAWQGRGAAHDHARLSVAGVMARQVRTADGLAALLSRFMGMQVRVEQFVGRWMPLAAAERSRIGRRGAMRRLSSAQLGRSVVLGRSVFDRQHHIRIHIGPLDREAFEALLPSGAALAALRDLVRHYLGVELGWDLQLALQADQVPAAALGRGSRLGWNSWMGQARRQRPGVLTLRPDDAALA